MTQTDIALCSEMGFAGDFRFIKTSQSIRLAPFVERLNKAIQIHCVGAIGCDSDER
jgi:hypothetical protein